VDVAAPLDRSSAETVTWDIGRIISQAQSGKLRVPTFQRSFVWTKADVLKLFDSVYRGFPIGTLLLWAKPAPAGRAVFGPVSFDVGAESEAFWVVDGQQRISALVGTLAPDLDSRDERFQVFFDFSRGRFVGSIRGARPPRSIPIGELLESRRLLAWLREFGDDLEDVDLQTADAVGGALRDYRIPAYIVTDSNEELLREVFDRVNSAGRPMSRAQVFHALFAQDSDSGSPSSVSDSLRALDFGRVDENRVVQSLLAIRGGDVARDLHDEFGAGEDPSEWYDRTEVALRRSIQFLKSNGAGHELLLPTTFPLPVLAAFFALHPDEDFWIERLLARWLWRGFVHGFGREGGQTPALRRAVRTVNPEFGRVTSAPDAYEAVNQLVDSVDESRAPAPAIEPFITRRASARQVLLALASLVPLDLDGAPINVGRALDELGPSAAGQIVDAPMSAAGSRAFWLPTWPRLTGNEDELILRSHLISSDAAGLLRKGSHSAFLKRRSADLVDLTLNFLDSKMEIGWPTRPPISSLLVGDPGSTEDAD
jgi:hypothetical protein